MINIAGFTALLHYYYVAKMFLCILFLYLFLAGTPSWSNIVLCEPSNLAAGNLLGDQARRTNLVKMILMPQLLYVLHNSPVWIPFKHFHKFQGLFRHLVWKKGVPRIR